MPDDASARAIAARIQGILAGQHQGVIEAAAIRLGVSEISLRMSVDDIEPHPTVDVVLAIVQHLGVDPAWLLTGRYDATIHRAAVDEEADRPDGNVARLVARQLSRLR